MSALGRQTPQMKTVNAGAHSAFPAARTEIFGKPKLNAKLCLVRMSLAWGFNKCVDSVELLNLQGKNRAYPSSPLFSWALHMTRHTPELNAAAPDERSSSELSYHIKPSKFALPPSSNVEILSLTRSSTTSTTYRHRQHAGREGDRGLDARYRAREQRSEPGRGYQSRRGG